MSPNVTGLQLSSFSNIVMENFRGHGIYLEGGVTQQNNNSHPNQFLVFENVRVTRCDDNVNALLMTGQNGQVTFKNCNFDGFLKDHIYAHGAANIAIYVDYAEYMTSSVVSFINCGCRNSQYGVSLIFAQNITFESCMFENLGIGITVEGLIDQGNYVTDSKSINTRNCRFYNVGGFGTQYVLTPNDNYGDTIRCADSEVNVQNNYVNEYKAPTSTQKSSFVMSLNERSGVNANGNGFGVETADVTQGIVPLVAISGGKIDCKHHQIVYISNNTLSLTQIESTFNAGETLTIKANGGIVSLRPGGNLLLPASVVPMNDGANAVFVKIDREINGFKSCYFLVSMRLS